MRARPSFDAAVAATVVVGAVLLSGLMPVRAAGASSSEEFRLLALANQARAAAGAPPLTLDPAVSAVSRAWAQTMAARGDISHNPNMGSQIRGWSQLAENVGFGPSIDWVHQAMLGSPTHYRNLTDPAFTLVGIGVVSDGMQVFVVENFTLPAGGGGSGQGAYYEPEPEPEPEPPPRRTPTTAAAAPAPPPTTAAPPPVVVPQRAPAPRSSQFPFVLEGLRALDDHNGLH